MDVSEAAEPADLANKSVVKAMLIVRELAKHPRGATVSALATATGHSRPTAFRLLNSLEQTGFVDRTENVYQLGWELARLGRLADPYAGIVARVQPVLDELATTVNENVTLSVPTADNDFDVIAEAAGSRIVNVTVRKRVGQHFPLHASSVGKIILAELATDELVRVVPETLERFTAKTITSRAALLNELNDVREQGYAIIDNELEEELLSVSRPVRDSAGTLVAVLSVDGPRHRFGRDRIPEALQQLRHGVEQIRDLLWSWG
jgi:DNA-binding IclR family transcriptional regulator